MFTILTQDYSDASEAGRLGPAIVREKILSKLAQVYKRCNSQLLSINPWLSRVSNHENFVRGNGNGIIIFDEIQKIVPGSLDFLPKLFDNDFFFEHEGIRYSVASTIIILITDVGVDDIVKLSLINRDEGISHQQMRRNIIKSLIDKHWDRLRIGKFVNEMVPFFPLSQSGLEKIMDSKLHEDRIFYVQRKWMSDMIVESGVISFLCSSSFVQYDTYTLSSVHDENLIGAMNTDNRSNYYASYGARSILNAGPLYDIRQLIFAQIGHIRDDFLYIGIICDGNVTNPFIRGDRCNSSDETKLLLAWCNSTIVDDDFRSIQMEKGSVLWDFRQYFPYFPESCNSIWTGSLERPRE